VRVTRTRVEVRVSASKELGAHSADLVLSGGGADENRVTVFWRVDPWESVSPRSLIVTSGEENVKHTLVLRSAKSPFRILRVEPQQVLGDIDFSGASSVTQSLVLIIDRIKSSSKVFQITIHTDHPEVAEVVVPVRLLPRADLR